MSAADFRKQLLEGVIRTPMSKAEDLLNIPHLMRCQFLIDIYLYDIFEATRPHPNKPMDPRAWADFRRNPEVRRFAQKHLTERGFLKPPALPGSSP